MEKAVPPYSSTTPEAWRAKVEESIPVVNTFSPSLNPDEVAANTVADQTFTVEGLTTDDAVVVNPPALDSGLTISYARVSADDTLQIRFHNTTGSPVNPASGTYYIIATRV
jgi:hypothetical protein